MKLSEEQLKFIEYALKDHGIRYEDVRMELYDHFVTGIEEEMDQGKSFGQAFKDIQAGFETRQFRRFIFGTESQGLKAVEEEYVTLLSRQYKNQQWEILKSYFRLPTLLYTVLASVGLYWFALTMITSGKNEELFRYSLHILLGSVFVGSLVFAFRRKVVFGHYNTAWETALMKRVIPLSWAGVLLQFVHALSVMRIEPQVLVGITTVFLWGIIAYAASFAQLSYQQFRLHASPSVS